MTASKPDTGCVFCDAPRPPHSDSLIVYERKTCYVILNLYPYNNGHLMVVPYRHTGSLASLTTDELHEMADLQALSEKALVEAYQPHGINVGVNLGKPAGAGVSSPRRRLVWGRSCRDCSARADRTRAARSW